MEEKKLIAQYLYDMAKESKSEFIEIAVDSELAKVAKKMNLVVPSPDIAILRTIYAEVDKPNRNKIVLPKEAAKKALPTLVGKQANWSHRGKNFVCGWILNAELEDDKIITYIAIYKSLFSEEFETMKEMVKDNKMASSFEIWNRDPDSGKSVLHDLGNDTYAIDPILYHGIGILIEGETPACPSAYADKLLATADEKLILEAEKIILNSSQERTENLVYASMALAKEEPKDNEKEEAVMIKCEKCGKEFESTAEEKICVECASLPKEESKTQLPEDTKTEEKTTETKTEEKSEVAETKVEETKVEETTEEKSEAKPEEAPKAEAEAKVEEPKVEEKAEEKKEEVAEEKKEEAQPLEVIEPKIVVKVTSIYSETVIDTFVDGTPSGAQEIKGLRVKITEYKDGTKDEVSEEVEIKKKYDFAELEAKVNEAKAEKDVEISSLKSELEKLDNEIKKLQDELGKKDQEIAELKTPKVEEKKEKELTVGAVDSEVKSEIKKQADKINEIIANKGK